MRRIVISLFLLAAATLHAQAQQVRRWSEGLPDWAGFSIVEQADSASSFASFTFIKDDKVVRTPGVVYHYRDVAGALLTGMSWVRSDSMTEAELRSVRQDFDILEHFARMYRDEQLFRKCSDKEFISRFHEACAQAEATGDYSQYRLSAEPFDITKVPYEVSGENRGTSISLFTNQPFGDQGRLLHPTAGVSLAYEIGQGPDAFQAEISAGLGLYKAQYQTFLRRPVPYISMFAYYRRELTQAGKWKISLFGGPGYAARRFMGHYQMRVTVSGPAVCEGICADLHVGRHVFFGPQRFVQSDHSVQVKLSASQIYNVSQGHLIPAVQISAGYSFMNREIRRKQP